MITNEDKYLAFWRENQGGVRPRDVTVHSIKLTLNQNVFNPEPGITNSSSIVLGHVPDLDGKSIMDLGVGSGILAVYCAFKGAKSVLATDIYEAALQNASSNIQKHGMDETISTRKSFLFRNVKERFDVILANLPILPQESQADLYEELLSELPRHLKIGGKLYITQASFGNPDELEQQIKRHSFEFETIVASKLGVNWHLFVVSL